MSTDLRKIIHIDMDAFFASVEQLDNPKLRGKPVVVGGNPQKRGVVAACSYEARKFGIHSAMPCSRAYQLCRHAIFTKPRMWRYKEISLEIMELFKEYTDLVEPLSVDEAFLDVTLNKREEPSATLLADTIRKHIFSETGLTASAGVSYNKFLAKIASDINKPNGLTVITPDQALEFLEELPIRKFYGVGKATENKMKNLGIKKGVDLKRFSKEDLLFHFGKGGSFFYHIVRGRDERAVKISRVRKSIGSETTLQEDTLDIDEVREIISRLIDRIIQTMEKKECSASTVTIKIRYHDFTTVTRSKTSKYPINTHDDIRDLALGLLKLTKAGQEKVRLIGVSVSNLIDNKNRKPVQLMLPFIKNV